jgi:hypothetical protein
MGTTSSGIPSAGFTYGLGRLKPRVSYLTAGFPGGHNQYWNQCWCRVIDFRRYHSEKEYKEKSLNTIHSTTKKNTSKLDEKWKFYITFKYVKFRNLDPFSKWNSKICYDPSITNFRNFAYLIGIYNFYFSSNFVVVLEWSVLRAFGSMLTVFLYLLRFPR